MLDSNVEELDQSQKAKTEGSSKILFVKNPLWYRILMKFAAMYGGQVDKLITEIFAPAISE